MTFKDSGSAYWMSDYKFLVKCPGEGEQFELEYSGNEAWIRESVNKSVKVGYC